MYQIYAQKKDSTWVGSVRGSIIDREHNIMLRAATASIYLLSDSSLLAYRLTDNYGVFECKDLPCGVPIYIIASYVGHNSSTTNFVISPKSKQHDLGSLDLPFSATELQEVTIKASIPPVQMNGDTLEFNASAFKLDPNAQAEDLLRVLPGIVVWADGTITVNGREIKSVLVNGKPFFGTDARVATQNIPKDIIDKIQVYQKDKDPRKLTDSISEINIKLRKNSGKGYFGKVSGGVGTGKRYEGDGTLNFFSAQTQLGLAFSSNSINRVANDIDFILRNNTFKAGNGNIEYQSNLDIKGLNKFTAGGILLQHDFIKNVDRDNNNRINSTYFVKDNNQDLKQITRTVTTDNGNAYFVQDNSLEQDSRTVEHNSVSTYEKIKDGNKFSVDAKYHNNQSNATLLNQSIISNDAKLLLSDNSVRNSINSRVTSKEIKANYKHKIIDNDQSWLSQYELSNQFVIDNSNSISNNQSKYVSYNETSLNRTFDRIYDDQSRKITDALFFSLPNFGKLFFGNYKPAGIETGLKTNVELGAYTLSSVVEDRDSQSEYALNNYLTNKRSENNLKVTPALSFSKRIHHELSNRYDKTFVASANLAVQLNQLNSESEKDFQIFSRSFVRFMPTAEINYTNRQFGESSKNYSVQLQTYSQYPTVQQIAPVIDSINLNFIQVGNPSLKAQDVSNINLHYNYQSESNKNLSVQADLSLGYIHNYFTPYNSIDSLGRITFYTINANGYRNLSGSTELRKAFKYDGSQIQFQLAARGSVSRIPNYTNQIFSFYVNKEFSFNPGLYYSLKNWFNINLQQKNTYSFYLQQIENAIDLKSFTGQSSVQVMINCTEKLSIGTSVIYNRNKYNDVLVNQFTIWNASAGFKFLKGDIAEFKLTAWDLLRQNKGLINYGYNNSVTQGTVSSLKQYFMLTLAYFPRRFTR